MMRTRKGDQPHTLREEVERDGVRWRAGLPKVPPRNAASAAPTNIQYEVNVAILFVSITLRKRFIFLAITG